LKIYYFVLGKVFFWLTGKSKKSTTVNNGQTALTNENDVNTSLFQSHANSVDQLDGEPEGVDLNL
jgi:hypothetical protein